MWVRVDPDGDLLLGELPLVLVDTLHRLPELLTSDDPRIRDRLLPRTYEGDDDEEHWRRYVTPDLEHLFASRAETVRKDLRTLEMDVDADDGEFAMRIPGRHRAAWQAALTGGAHAIFQRAGLTAEDMKAEPGGLGDTDRDVALLRIMVLNALQWLILESEGHSDPPREVVEGWEPGFGDPDLDDGGDAPDRDTPDGDAPNGDAPGGGDPGDDDPRDQGGRGRRGR